MVRIYTAQCEDFTLGDIFAFMVHLHLNFFSHTGKNNEFNR